MEGVGSWFGERETLNHPPPPPPLHAQRCLIYFLSLSLSTCDYQMALVAESQIVALELLFDVVLHDGSGGWEPLVQGYYYR